MLSIHKNWLSKKGLYFLALALALSPEFISKATLAEIDDYRVTNYPKYDDDLESVLGELFGGPFGSIKQQLPPELGLWLNNAKALQHPANQIQTSLPYTLNIE